MATTDRDALVGLLAAHWLRVWAIPRHNTAEAECSCGWCDPNPGSMRMAGVEHHRAHLADVIEAHHAERMVEEWGVRYEAGRDLLIEHGVESEVEARAMAADSPTDTALVHRYVTEWRPVDA